MVEMFQLICHSRIIALQRGCYFNLHLRIFRWMFQPNSSKVERRQASKRWMESCRGGGLQSVPYLPFLISLNNLQFKEKNPLILFHTIKLCFFCIKEVKSRLSHVLRSLVKIPCWLLWVLTFSICPDWKVLERPQTCSETMGTQMRRPFTPCRGYGGNGGEGNSEERPLSYYSN